MSPAHDTGGDGARKRARRIGWRRALAAALVALAVQAAGIGWELAEPEPLALAGRIATLLCAALLSLAASTIASAFAGPRFGWIAGLAVGLMPITVHLAATRSADVAATACAALAWVVGGLLAARVAARSPRRRRALQVLSGVVAIGLVGGLHGFGASAPADRVVTNEGVLALLKATGDAFLVAGGYVGGAGLLLLIATAVLRRRFAALLLLLPAVAYVAVGVLPAGTVAPAATLPIALCSAIALAWSIANVPGEMARRKRVLLGGLVALWGLGEASGVIEAKHGDARPLAVAALAARRAPGEEVWICSLPEGAAGFAPFPSIAPPCRVVTWTELEERAARGEPPPPFLWLALAPDDPRAAPDAIAAAGAPFHLRLIERFATTTRAPLADVRDGLVLPVVALFTSKP